MKSLQWNFVERGLLIGHLPMSPGRDAAEEKQRRLHAALFDLDGTLINTKSRELHAQNTKDWEWWDPVVPARLRCLYEEGYHIIILTNQGRLTTVDGDESSEASLFKAKLDDIFGEFDICLTIYAACGNNIWRKPRTGAWHKMQEDFARKGFTIEWDQAFLVGDAAGRPKDHADADWHFCLNVGIDFYTPEEFFTGGVSEPRGHKFDPTLYLQSPVNKSARAISEIITRTVPSLIVFVGLPGSGKSTFFKQHMQIDNIAYIDPRASTGVLSPLEVAKDYLLKKENVVVGKHSEADTKIFEAQRTFRWLPYSSFRAKPIGAGRPRMFGQSYCNPFLGTS
ncbi:PNK3P-domain-containing protein [Rhizodiscina lignyota]|uniref:PNK3P-domain-containing protein n=1 Tax=Rhizodiscina lignyota TaxID=1504668 RepID=A0A9P4I1Z6_9PEZI|nr:PNK3P-domain-containing protein [Rhizodiscina lignyota]